MGSWDWKDIVVVSGQWWLVLIGLALLLAGMCIGWVMGMHAEQKANEYYPSSIPRQNIWDY